MSYQAISSEFRRKPVALTVILIIAAGFLLCWGAPSVVINLIFDPSFLKPWAALTYAVVGVELLNVLLSGYWAYMMTQALEAQRGSAYAAVAWLTAIVAFPVVSIALIVLHQAVPLVGLWLPLAAMTVMWAGAFPEMTIQVMLIIPIKAKWLALATVALVFFGFGIAHVVASIAFVAVLGLFWFLGKRTIELPDPTKLRAQKQKREERREFEKYRDDVRSREMAREEKEKLRRIFEASQLEDPEDK